MFVGKSVQNLDKGLEVDARINHSHSPRSYFRTAPGQSIADWGAKIKFSLPDRSDALPDHHAMDRERFRPDLPTHSATTLKHPLSLPTASLPGSRLDWQCGREACSWICVGGVHNRRESTTLSTIQLAHPFQHQYGRTLPGGVEKIDSIWPYHAGISQL